MRLGKPTRPLVAAIAAVIVVLAGGVSLVVLLGSGGRGPGPIEGAEDSSLGVPTQVGRSFGFGLPVAINTGDEVATLERIYPIGVTRGLKLLATRVGGPRRTFFGTTASLGWPAPKEFDDVHPVRGFPVAPHQDKAGKRGAQLIFVVRADRPGSYVIRKIGIDYRIGDDEYRDEIHNALRACVTPRGKPRVKHCWAPGQTPF